MAATNYTPIQHYRTSTADAEPNAANLVAGELAINTTDVAVYTKNTGGTVKRIMNNPAGLKYPTADGSANQVIKTDGAGTLSFMSASSIASLVLPYVYPVGSIYANDSDSTNPATILGFGTWTAIEGRGLMGYKSGSTYFGTAGAESGSVDAVNVSHTHTATSVSNSVVADPGHAHTINSQGGFSGGSGYVAQSAVYQGTYATNPANTNVTVDTTTTTTITSAGVAGTGANLQPYRTVYLWRRTA